MKYALLGDIHSNLEALESVLADARSQGATHYACLGDIVGYNASPKECLETVRSLDNCSVVQGNHDYYAGCEQEMAKFSPLAAEGIRWTRKQLSREERAYLANLPLTKEVETFTIAHGSPCHPENWPYVMNSKLAQKAFRCQATRLCFVGHSHVPLLFRWADGELQSGRYSTLKIKPGDGKHIINIGSVGQPRDNDPRAAYVILDLLANTLQLRRVKYDIERAQSKIRATSLPERNAARIAKGR